MFLKTLNNSYLKLTFNVDTSNVTKEKEKLPLYQSVFSQENRNSSRYFK